MGLLVVVWVRLICLFSLTLQLYAAIKNVHGIPCGGPCLHTGVSVNIPTHHHGCAHTFFTSLKSSMVVVILMVHKKTLSFESVWVTEAGGVLLGV